MELDLQTLLTPVSENTPSGESLEYDQAYMALEALATGAPASEMGDSIAEGKDPDFRKLQSECLKLWSRTRDIRLASYLAISSLALDGLQGFADGLECVKYLMENLWDSFWPQLDPDDDNDPTERINIIHMLSPDPRNYGDPIHFINLFRTTRLVPVGPKYTIRDLMIADNELDVQDSKIDSNLLYGEISAVPQSVLTAQNEQVLRCLDLLEACKNTFDEKSPDNNLNLEAITSELKRLKKFYAKLTMQGHSEDAAPADTEVSSDVPHKEAPAAAGRPQAVFDLQSYKPRTRSDALLLLQKSAEYFQSAEPNSPVPFMLNRAVRLANMNFIELLSELTPDAVDRGRDILGVKPENNSDY